jgi:sec-independent protein translocase protein TatA
MTTNLNEIRTEIERLTERRAELFHRLSESHDPALAAEHQELDERIAQLWEAQRIERARLRFGALLRLGATGRRRLAIALLVVGPRKLPQRGRSLGGGLREFKDSLNGRGDGTNEDVERLSAQLDRDERDAR